MSVVITSCKENLLRTPNCGIHGLVITLCGIPGGSSLGLAIFISTRTGANFAMDL